MFYIFSTLTKHPHISLQQHILADYP